MSSNPYKGTLARAAQRYFTVADDEGRELNYQETMDVETLLKAAEMSGPNLPDATDITKALTLPPDRRSVRGDGSGVAFGAPDPGSRLTASAAFKAISDPSKRPQRFDTGPIPVTDGPPTLSFKGTLMEAGGFGGGPLVGVPQVVPGIVPALAEQPRLENVLGAAVATSPSIRFITESTATSGAAGVGEGSAKPQSTLGFTATTTNVTKVATWVGLSDEILDDAPAIQSFVNGELMRFVNLEVERQLLRGGANSAEVVGLLDSSRGIPVYTGVATDPKSVQLFKALNSVRGSAFLEPEWVVLHPGDYEDLRLYRDSTGGTLGAFLGGGPWFGLAGQAGAMAGPSPQVTGGVETIWNKPIVVTSAIAWPGVSKGTALIGTRGGASVYSKGGISVEMSNSATANGVDFFTSDLVAIRSERRLALAVFRSRAFCEVHFS